MPNLELTATGGPYRLGPFGYYKESDHSGPYTIDSNGNAALMTVITASTTSLPAGTNRSGTITAGGTAQQLAAANTSRKGLTGQNISNGDLWINETNGGATSAAPDAPGSFRVPAGQYFSIQTNRLISIYGATTGQAFTATEY